MTQIYKKFRVMKHHSCRQLRMLTVGELTELRNNKASRDLTAVSLEILANGVKHNVSSLVLSLCMSDSSTKVDLTRNVMAHAQKPESGFLRNGRVHLNRRGEVSSFDCWQPRCAHQR